MQDEEGQGVGKMCGHDEECNVGKMYGADTSKLAEDIVLVVKE